MYYYYLHTQIESISLGNKYMVITKYQDKLYILKNQLLS